MAKLTFRDGSNKSKVYDVFKSSGKEAAIKKAVKLGLKEATARTWCSSWGGGSSKPAKKAAVKAKKPVKKTAKKTPAKKKPAARVRSKPEFGPGADKVESASASA